MLEEYTGQCHPRHEFDLAPREAELFIWRRDEPEQLAAALDSLQRELAATEKLDLAALGHALAADEAKLDATANGRCRLAIVATSIDDLSQKLRQAMAQVRKADAAASTVTNPIGIYYSAAAPVAKGAVCFLFPGQGSQSVNMLKDLTLVSPDLLEIFSQADAALADILPEPLSHYIYPVPVFDAEAKARLTQRLGDTRVAQPALGVTGLVAARLLERFGLSPAAVAGHSYGEYVALCVAGAFSEEDLFRLSAQRGQIVHECTESSPGSMAAVAADGETTSKALESLGLSLCLANLNSPDQTIIAGPVAEIEAAVAALVAAGLRAKRIPVTAAFHTPAMTEAAGKLAQNLEAIPFQSLRLPVWSNTTAAPYPAAASDARQQLVRHLTSPVLFEKQIRGLYAAGTRIFLEVGAGAVLTGLVGRILGREPHTAIALDAPGRSGTLQLAHLLAQCSALGLPVDACAWSAGRRLPNLGVAKLCALSRQQQVRRPTDWVVNGGQSRPLMQAPADLATAKPAIAAEPTLPELTIDKPIIRKTTVPAAPATAIPTLRETTMSVHPATNGDRPMPQVSTPSHPESPALGTALVPALAQPSPVALQALAYFQTSMAQWLDLQKTQQTANQQFLLTQERVLLAFMHGGRRRGVWGHLGSRTAPDRADAALHRVGHGPAHGCTAPVVAANRPQAVAPHPTAPMSPARGHAPVSPMKPSATASKRPHRTAPLRRARMSNGSHAKPAPSSSGTHAAGPPSTEQFRRDLLETVTLRTGYPIEMLNEALPLEAGLGIDSIKTLEIFNALKQYHPFFRDDDQQDQDDVLVEFAQLKTLGKIVDAYDLKRQRFLEPATNGKSSAGPHHDNGHGSNGSNGVAVSSAVVERFEVAAVAAPLAPESREKKIP